MRSYSFMSSISLSIADCCKLGIGVHPPKSLSKESAFFEITLRFLEGDS